jgi:acetyl esterase/lipase
MTEPANVELEAADHKFSIRVYPAAEPYGAVLVWAHGGGFLGGSLDMPEADEVARRMADSGASVVSVGYSLAPPDPLWELLERGGGDDRLPSREELEAEIAAAGPRVRFPVASLQTVAAFDWAVEHAKELGGQEGRVGLGGASAGGNLTAGAALRLRDRGDRQPAVLLQCYPVLHADLPAPNDDLAAALADQPAGRSSESSRTLTLNYVGDPVHLANPYAFPGGHNLRGLPPTLIVTAGRDHLRSSAEAFAAELALASVDVTIAQERGFAHGFLNEVGHPAAVRTIARFARALQES